MKLYCLHGFLGAPHDWDDLEAGLGTDWPELSAPGTVVKADLFGADFFPDTSSISAWADMYCQRRMQAGLADLPAAGRCLLGYSMGGRLALHLAVQHPELWDAVIIVGANPGTESEDARAQRRRHDETWACRFESEAWDTLLAAWDAQPVFAGRRNPLRERREQDFSRARLADALRRWSVGAQSPLWDALRTLPCPMLWVAGSEDATQVPVCAQIRDTVPHVEIWTAPDAGHRVPWEQPRAFAARVREFLTMTQRRLENKELENKGEL